MKKENRNHDKIIIIIAIRFGRFDLKTIEISTFELEISVLLGEQILNGASMK